MTTPNTPAQTPVEQDIEAHVRAEREVSRARAKQRMRKIMSVGLPLAILLVVVDVMWGNFVVFGARSKHAEPKSVLHCLARNGGEPSPFVWSGSLDALALRERSKSECIRVSYSRYDYVRTPPAGTPALFVAFPQEERRTELGDDVWAVETGGRPVHCFNAIVPRPLLLPVRAPKPDPSPVCAKAFELLGVDATGLEPAR